jgi:phenylpyruvate tautomerase PptA (4-oxalocrotonate tautomerase family)
MPMIDAFIPESTLTAAAETALIKKVTDLMVGHELRRIVDLIDDPAEAEASHQRATQLAWVFLHRTRVYVGGETAAAPVYKFVVSIPEGQVDDEFRDSIVPDITTAVAEAENGKWPHLPSRVWVFVHEVPDGSWGAGRTRRLGEIVDYVAPGLGGLAEERLAGQRRDAARDTVALAETATSRP